MRTDTMHLFVDAQHASPYAMSVYVALTEKALPFTTAALDLSQGEQHGQAFGQVSLTARVPTLVHNGFSLSESTAITEYLEAIAPHPPLYPDDVQQRAKARQLQAWLRSDLMALRTERPTEVIFYGPSPEPLSPAALAAACKLIRAAEQLLGDGREHLFERWSLADLDLALMLNRLVMNADTVPDPLADYARRQWQRPSIQRWLALPRPPLAA